MPVSFYRRVDVHLHGDAKVLALTPEPPSGRGLFKHLLICPELSPLPGVIRFGAAAMAESLEWPLESFLERFGELVREGLAQADWKARLIFLTNGIRYNAPDNPNQVIGWARHWNALPDSALKTTIWERYLDYFTSDAERRRKEIAAGTRDKRQDSEALLKAFRENIAKPGAAASEQTVIAATAPGPRPVPAARTREKPAALSPSRAPVPGNTAAPIPGEALLDRLAQELQATHPRGLAGGTDLQHALLHALKTGELRADGVGAKPGIHSITLSELRERHAAWCAAWAAGASLPMNLANWIDKRRCWHELARLRTPGETWGRPAVAINPIELLTWWEGRAGRHPASLRDIAKKLGISEATTRKHLRALRAAGQVDDPARVRALAARGGLRRGGRPANPLDDATLTATWSQTPSLSAVARHLHVSRRRVRVRLQQLDLLPPPRHRKNR